MTILVYGTGRMATTIAHSLQYQGLDIICAGRNRIAVKALGDTLGVPWLVSPVDSDAIDKTLTDCTVLINAAGPFIHTAPMLMRKSVEQATHYLDISNEFGILAQALHLDDRAQQNRICIVPGVAFGVAMIEHLATKLVNNQQVDTLKIIIESPRTASTPGVAATVQHMKKIGPLLFDHGEFRPPTSNDHWLKENIPPAPSGALETLAHTNLAQQLTTHYTNTTAQHTTINIKATQKHDQTTTLTSTFQETTPITIHLIEQALLALSGSSDLKGICSPMEILGLT